MTGGDWFLVAWALGLVGSGALQGYLEWLRGDDGDTGFAIFYVLCPVMWFLWPLSLPEQISEVPRFRRERAEREAQRPEVEYQMAMAIDIDPKVTEVYSTEERKMGLGATYDDNERFLREATAELNRLEWAEVQAKAAERRALDVGTVRQEPTEVEDPEVVEFFSMQSPKPVAVLRDLERMGRVQRAAVRRGMGKGGA